MAKSRSLYDVHPGVAMVRKWVAELPAKTGRTLEQWADVYRKLEKKYPARRELTAFAKQEYGLGSITADQIWEYSFGKQTWEGDDATYLAHAVEYVDDAYRSKPHFRPLFEKLVDFARTLGDDVRICPCKTMVPLYRKRVFAEMRPATKTRFELALCLVDVPFDELLQLNPRAKGNDRQRHIIRMETEKDFTATVKKWLKTAYQQDK